MWRLTTKARSYEVWNSDWNSGLNVLLDTLIGGSVFHFWMFCLGPPAADFQLRTINRVENVSSADAASLDCFLISESLRTLFLKTGLLFAKCESLSLGHRHHLPSCLLPQKARIC